MPFTRIIKILFLNMLKYEINGGKSQKVFPFCSISPPFLAIHTCTFQADSVSSLTESCLICLECVLNHIAARARGYLKHLEIVCR